MLDLNKYYQIQNDEISDHYQDTLLIIKNICAETKDYKNTGEKEECFRFFNHAGSFILQMAENETNWKPEYFLSRGVDELRQENNLLFDELLPENYSSSYTNPAYSASVLGLENGRLFAFFYSLLRQNINYAMMHKIYKMEELNRLFIKLFNHVNDNGFEFEELMNHIEKHEKRDRTKETIVNFGERYNSDFSYFRDIVIESDLNNLKYLFLYGEYVTDFELQTAMFLQNYPLEKVQIMARQIVEAYIKGFELKGKDPFKKKAVSVGYQVGQEIIIREIVKALEEKGLTALVGNPQSARANRQYDYDHRFDMALWADEEFSDVLVHSYENAFKDCKHFVSEYSGVIYLQQFGEKPFKPVTKKENLKLTDEQQELYQLLQNKMSMLHDKYIPRSETSFTVMAVPSPEIGDQYEQIFEDILEVNMLESKVYEGIQQHIIDALDKASYVHVKGQNGNLTDIKVKMQKLQNPLKETNFVNCGADVNIPVGEVFTSPNLNGTNGVLHVGETFLRQLKYIDLKLTFKDGFISDYDCGNFDNPEANKKYIEENLMFPHKTLPMGEFAIGTNTLAYVIARKYDILDVLPILIIEKMGPHFAVGDTCFSHEEDVVIYNPLDKKEITARDNEKTIQRKEDFNKAYTNVHTDITLPYEEIGFISAITDDGQSIDIIREGRFTLEGTEDLNIPLDGRT